LTSKTLNFYRKYDPQPYKVLNEAYDVNLDFKLIRIDIKLDSLVESELENFNSQTMK